MVVLILPNNRRERKNLPMLQRFSVGRTSKREGNNNVHSCDDLSEQREKELTYA